MTDRDQKTGNADKRRNAHTVTVFSGGPTGQPTITRQSIAAQRNQIRGANRP